MRIIRPGLEKKKRPTSYKGGRPVQSTATSAAPRPQKRAGGFVPSGCPDFTFSVAYDPYSTERYLTAKHIPLRRSNEYRVPAISSHFCPDCRICIINTENRHSARLSDSRLFYFSTTYCVPTREQYLLLFYCHRFLLHTFRRLRIQRPWERGPGCRTSTAS